jgi:hypothetical protein
MKNRNRLITAGIGLLMVFALFFGSAAAIADSGMGVPAPGAPGTVTITSPVNNSFVNTPDVFVEWTVTGGANPSWNLTWLYNVTDDYTSPVVNVSTDSSFTWTGLADGVYRVYVENVAVENSSDHYYHTFTVATALPSVELTNPVPGGENSFNDTNFTATWTASPGVEAIPAPLAHFVVNITDVNADVSQVLTINDPDARSVAVADVWGDDLPDGSYQINVTVVDEATNVNWSVAAFDITPIVEITYPTDYITQVNFTATWEISLTDEALDFITVHFSNATIDSGWVDVGSNLSIWIQNLTGGVNLTDGSYLLEVNVTDVAGTNYTDEQAFVIDTTPPEIDITVPTEDQIYYTADNNFTAEWTATDANLALVNARIVMDGVNGTWMDVTGETSMYIAFFNNNTNLSDGSYVFEVFAEDLAGLNYTESAAFVVDTAVPTIEIVVPEDGSWINDNNFTVEWTANGTGSPIDHFVVVVESDDSDLNWTATLAGDVTSIPIGNITGGALADGNYSMSITVFDSVNLSATADADFGVDTGAPTIEIEYPLDGQALSATEVLVVWEGIDSMSGIAGYQFRLDDGNWSDMVNWTIVSNQFTILTDGDHTVDVMAFDNATNNATATVSFITDVLPPEMTINAPANGSWFNVRDVTVEWNVTDDEGGVAYIWIMIDGGDFINVTGNTSQEFTGLADGMHTVTLRAADTAANVGEVSVEFGVDTVPPAVNILNPDNGAFLDSADVTVSWNGVDSGSGIDHYEVSIDDGAFVSVEMNTSHQFVGLAEGIHTVVVKALDVAGNNGTDTVTFTVDLTPPVVEIISPADNAKFADKNVTVMWNATDALSGLAYIQVRIDGGDWTLVGTDLSHSFVNLADGNHVVDVRGVDNAGNLFVATVHFMTDVTAPVIDVISPAEGAHFRNTSVLASWNVTDATSGVDLVQIRLDGGNWTNVSALGSHEYTNLISNNHSFEVRAVDVVGNVAVKSVEFIVDMVAPEVAITFPDGSVPLNAAVITATWTASDPLSGIANISVMVDGGAPVFLAANVTSYAMAGLTAGTHTFAVKAVDGVGNNATVTVSFIVDRTAPTVTAHTPLSAANAVSVTSTITVTFSEAMGAVNIVLSPSISGTTNHAGNVYTLTLSSAMAHATNYSVTVTGSDLAGNPLASTSWSYSTICQLTGIINGPDGKPINNATVTLKDSNGFVVGTAHTAADGSFAIEAAPGVYNATISSPGNPDTTKQVTLAPGSTANNLGSFNVAGPDYTWVIIVVIIVIVVIILVLFMLRRRKVVVVKK